MKKTLVVDVNQALTKRPAALVEALNGLLDFGIEIRVEAEGDPKACRDELAEQLAPFGVSALRVDELLFPDEVKSKRASEAAVIAAEREAIMVRQGTGEGKAAPTGPRTDQVEAAAKAAEKAKMPQKEAKKAE